MLRISTLALASIVFIAGVDLTGGSSDLANAAAVKVPSVQQDEFGTQDDFGTPVEVAQQESLGGERVGSDRVLGGSGFRSLAPGVLTTVGPNIGINEGVVYPRPFSGLNINKYSANFTPDSKTLQGQMDGRLVYRDVWQLEFAFKPLRHIEVSLPLAGGQSQITDVWYMVYRVRNLNQHLSFPRDETTGEAKFNLQTPIDQLDSSTLPGRFFPSFLLEGWVEDAAGNYSLKAYRDKILPAAVAQIAQEERMVGRLMDGFEIAREMLAPATDQSEGTWGVATWIDIDPRINFATVSVQGLSNAFRTDQDENAEQKMHQIKTLQINFWRPGDAQVNGDRFRLGIRFDDDLTRQVDVLKKYRLPGPDLTVNRLNLDTGALITMGRVPADFDLSTLQSAAIGTLDQQQVPAAMETFLKKFGFAEAGGLNVTVNTPGKRWTLVDADANQFVVTSDPVTWKISDEKIEFVGPLEYFWDYRYIY